MASPNVSLLLVLVSLMCSAAFSSGESTYATGLSENFYDTSCPQAASIVDAFVTKYLQKDRNFAGAFNRLQFHDCWVGGCDGSVLLNSTASCQCPKVGGPTWTVATGRRDGVRSTDLMADTNLPFPVLNFSGLVANFAAKGFNAREMITLSGAHTIGRSHCNGILPHLYNFTGKDDVTDTDPAMDKEFSVLLKTLCPQGNRTNTIFIDSTANHFDRLYYKNVLGGRGVFITDSALITDPGSKKVVQSFAKRSSTFFSEFAAAMVKMGDLGVLTGTQGEIRKTCQFVN